MSKYWEPRYTRHVLYLCRTPRTCAYRSNINIKHALTRKELGVNTRHQNRPRNHHKPTKRSEVCYDTCIKRTSQKLTGEQIGKG